MDVYSLLIIGHLIGTVLAVGGATMIEVQLNQALRDRTMSSDERDMLSLDFGVLRAGLLLSVFTGIGFIVFYFANGQMFRLENPVFWAKMGILLLVLVNALLLQAHKISLYWGSAISFVGWWGIMVSGMFLTQGVRFGFLEIVVVFALAVALGAWILHRVREYLMNKTTVHG